MARSIVIIWAAALALTAEAALTSTPRTLRPRAALLGAAATSDDCGNSLKSCADCYSVLTCANLNGVYRPLTTTACSTSLPYCLNGECVATIDSTESCYKKPSTEFTCVGDGYYPSPSNCKKYYLCVDSEAYEYDCTSYSNTVYSQEMAMCVPSSEATCSVVTCNTAKVGTYQTWAQDKSIYFVCTDTNATHAYVAACDSNQQINATTGNCELACLKEGRIADDDDPRSYYECVQTATNTFVGPTFATCPGNSTFSATTQRCVHATGGSSSSSSDDDAGEYPREEIYAPSNSVSETLYKVPKNLLIGSASSAYQVEGGWNASSKSANIWDVWFHSRPTADNGDVACDSYNKWQEDISLLQQMGMQSYRFSLSWTRLLPGGSQADGYDSAGVEYYNNLINGLIAVGITPIVTIFHWDLPQVYQNDGGWLNSAVADRFADFADFAFAQFGDRVKIWVLINEPNIYCGFAYEGTNWPPGIGQTGTGSYDCVHNQILAHAKAWQVYDTNYRAAQNGKLGSAMSQSWCEPASDSDEDKEAAERSLVFGSAWFFDPLATGDYPKVMRDTIDTNSAAEGLTTSRLPTFTEEEKAIIKGCSDFIAVNHYSTSLVRPGTAKLTDSASTSKDKNVTTSTRSSWQSVGGMTPWGLRYLLNWLYDRYGLPVLVAENGLQGSSDEGTNDPKRLSYYSLFMRATMRAANEDGVDVMGYTAWSLMDNLEWTSGYGPKYGLVYVDFDSDERTRTLKTSASLFQEVAQTGRVPYYAPPTTS